MPRKWYRAAQYRWLEFLELALGTLFRVEAISYAFPINSSEFSSH